MRAKTKGLIGCLSIAALVFLCSCKSNNKNKPSISPSADELNSYRPPSNRYPAGGKRNPGRYPYPRNDNDQYYSPLRNYNDNFDDNRDRLYR